MPIKVYFARLKSDTSLLRVQYLLDCPKLAKRDKQVKQRSVEGCVGNHQIHNSCAQTSETNSQFSIPPPTQIQPKMTPNCIGCRCRSRHCSLPKTSHGPSEVVAGTWADEMGFRGGHWVTLPFVWSRGEALFRHWHCCSRWRRFVDVILLEMLMGIVHTSTKDYESTWFKRPECEVVSLW